MDIFRNHIQSFAGPSSEALLSTRQIYESAIRNYNEPTKAFVPRRPDELVHKKKSGKMVTKSWPPHEEHPIRSMTYLKQVMLPDLDKRGLIEKVHRKRPPSELEQNALDAKKRKIMKRNGGRLANGHPPLSSQLENAVSEWLWRKREKSDEKWAEEEKSVEKLEGSIRWPDRKLGECRDPYDEAYVVSKSSSYYN